MLRGTALLLTGLTGFTALAYEVAWQRYLATLLGSHAEATAAILGLFLGGLSLGYELFGRLSRRLLDRARERGERPRLLFVYGLVEASIGAWVLAFPWFFDAVQALSGGLPDAGETLGFAIDVALSALLVLPPAIAMGGTIPFLTQALPRGLDDATRFHALVYGANTIGAFAGALAAGFVLIPWLGLARVMGAMGVINLAVGAIFVTLDRFARPSAPEPGERRGRAPVEGLFGLTAIAWLIGFALMTLQAAGNRIGALALGASPFTFSLIVALFVASIAIGSLGVSALRRVPHRALALTLWAQMLWLAALYRPIEDSPYWGLRLRVLFPLEDAAFLPFHASVLAALFAVVGVPLVLSGAALPLIFHQLRDRAVDLGAVAGRLYGWNTLGSLVGALVGGYLLFHVTDLHQVYRVALAALAAAAVAATVRQGSMSRLAGAALFAALAVGLALLPSWRTEHLTSGLFRVREAPSGGLPDRASLFAMRAEVMGKVVFHDDDPVASVTVAGASPLDRSIVLNGKNDSSTRNDRVTTELIGLLPALFAERVERAFVIGFGTGLTATAIADLDGIERVEVAEISPAVVAAAPLFDDANRGASKHPKIHFLRSDAYRALRRSRTTYDVIASEPSNVWVAGVEPLFSEEFLRAARERLRPGGIYAQWFHLYEADRTTLELALRTYATVFEHLAVWFTQGPDLLILGFADGAPAELLARLERRSARADFARGLRRAGIEDLASLVAHELWPPGAEAALPPGPLHTLHHPRLADRAGRAAFRQDSASLPFGGWGAAAEHGATRSLRAALAARHGGRLPDALRTALVRETCRHRSVECATLLARWRVDAPDSPALRRAMSDAEQRHRTGMGPELVERLHELFRTGGDPPSRPAYTLERLQKLYVRHYHHAAPFDPDALLALWERCDERASAPGACATGRDAAREMLRR